MAFIQAPQASDDEPQKIAPRTDYHAMSEQELELAYENACMDASGYVSEAEEYLAWQKTATPAQIAEYWKNLEAALAGGNPAQIDGEKPARQRPLSLQRRMASGLKRLRRMDAMSPNTKTVVHLVVHTQKKPHRRTRRAVRSSAASGDSNDDGDGDGEPPRPRPQLYDQAALADLLCISKKTLQNQYSAAPYTLPVAIHIPGCRGPRWTPSAVEEWLADRPRHTPAPAPVVAPKRKAGRPRIALAIKGVQS